MAGDGSTLTARRLREVKDAVVNRWEARVRLHLADAQEATRPVLVDSIPELLDRMAAALESPVPDRELESTEAIGALHGQQRAEATAFSLDEVILEYQLLRRALLEILDDGEPVDAHARDLISDAILAAVRNAATEFARLRTAVTFSAMRETDQRFRHMVDAVKDYAIFTVDPTGVITSWNVGCVRMNQYTADEAIGQHFQMLYPEEGRRRGEPSNHLRSAAIEGRYRGEGVRLRKNGELFLADVSITPIYDGRLSGFTKVVQDLTERNALMQERDLSRSDTVRLREESAYRDRFVATLTHDLRSPLATAKLGVDLIVGAPGDADKVRSRAQRIARSLQRADRMIADLLDASRLQAGEALSLELEACDLAAIAEELCDELASRHGDRFDLLVEGDVRGWWSPDGLRRVLDNLLSNAAKYGATATPITVGVRRVDDRVLLSVHNVGTIAVEEQPKLFQAFHRAPAALHSGQPGWGLGLALVKGIVEAHGGIVKAESYPREGTTFTVDLPVDARTGHELSRDHPGSPPGS
jgi:PAS domain S-box-containing protein